MSFPSYVNEHKSDPEHFVDTFATTYTGNDTPTVSNHRRPSLQRWNIALKVLTFVFTLGAVLCTIFAKATDDFGWSLTYKSSSAFEFFMIVNVVVCLYAFVLSIIVIVMFINGSGKSTPPCLVVVVLILDMICVVFLLLGFASAMATEVINRNGFWVKNGDAKANYSSAICKAYGNFCSVFEVALGFCGTAIITFLAGTAIDAFYLHLHRI